MFNGFRDYLAPGAGAGEGEVTGAGGVGEL